LLWPKRHPGMPPKRVTHVRLFLVAPAESKTWDRPGLLQERVLALEVPRFSEEEPLLLE